MYKMTKIIAIRMRGIINVAPDIKKTLNMLRLRKKFSCAILDDTPENIGKLKKVQNYISYGAVEDNVIKELIKKRARTSGNKLAKLNENDVKEFIDGKRKLVDLKIKPFFRLHPPRGGFKKNTRKLYPEGILGKNDKINEIIMKML